MRRAHRHLLAAFVALPLPLFAAGPAFAQEMAPPPPMNPPPSSGPGAPTTGDPSAAQQNQSLDQAEQKDSGRNFELFWIDGQINGAYINMRQFSSETFAIEQATAGGPAFALGAGLRLVIFVAGARLRYNALSSFNMWQINGEAGLKIPISSVDILFGLHGGYSFVGRLGDAGQATNTSTPLANDAVSIRGFNAGLEVAVDYYVSPLFSVGGGIIGDFLFLNRPAVAKPTGLSAADQAAVDANPLYQKSGTSAGLQLAGGLRLGLHFGL